MSEQLVRIGTSGFSYKDWLGNFYPQFCPQKDFLRFYSSKFCTVEIDATFYRVPTESMVAGWRANTPKGFVFAAKFPRTVTHEGGLRDRIATAEVFVGVMAGLEQKLGPLLLQFPYGFKPDRESDLKAIVESLPEGYRYAVELRNKAWLKTEAVLDFFRSRNVAFCLIDHPWMPRLDFATADFSYLRFLGDRKKIERDFSHVRYEREEDLSWWRDVIAGLSADGRELFAYFNNHYTGHSPTTAARMIELLG